MDDITFGKVQREFCQTSCPMRQLDKRGKLRRESCGAVLRAWEAGENGGYYAIARELNHMRTLTSEQIIEKCTDQATRTHGFRGLRS